MTILYNKTADGLPDLARPFFRGTTDPVAPEYASVLTTSGLQERPGSVILYVDSAAGGEIMVESALNCAGVVNGEWFNKGNVVVPAGMSVQHINAFGKFMRFKALSGGFTTITAINTAQIFGEGGGGANPLVATPADVIGAPILVEDPVTGDQFIARLVSPVDGTAPTLEFYDFDGNPATPANTPTPVDDVELATDAPVFFDAINAGVGYTVGDVISRTRVFNTSTGATTTVIYRNESTMADIIPTPGDLGLRDAPVRPEGVYNAAGVTIADGDFEALQLNENGALLTEQVNTTPVAEFTAAPLALADGDTDALQLRTTGELKTALENFNETATYNATDPVLADGEKTDLQVNTAGHLKVEQTNTTPVAEYTAGAIALADGDTDALQLRETGELKATIENFGETGVFNTTAPTLTDGDVAQLQLDINGNLKTTSDQVASRDGGTTFEAIPLTADGSKVLVEADVILEDADVAEYNATAPVLADTDTTKLQTNINGELKTEDGFEYNTTPPTLADGDITKAQLDVNGQVKVVQGVKQLVAADFEVFNNQGTAVTTTLASFKMCSIAILNQIGELTITFAGQTVTIEFNNFNQFAFELPALEGREYNFPVTITPSNGAIFDAIFTA